MRIILVEFSWHAKEILKNKKSFKDDVIVSLDPESSYILKSNKVPYFESYQFCNHSELWIRYKEITDRSIKIADVLDEALWNTDQRFKDLNWRFFNDYHYVLKISFDQLFYYSELISKLIEKFNPSEIIAADTNRILINKNFLINSKISVIKYLLETLDSNLNKIIFSFVSTEKINSGKLKNDGIKENFVKRKIKYIYHKINFLINYYILKPKYLSVGCPEISRHKKMYPRESKIFLTYDHRNTYKKITKSPYFFKSFTHYLDNKTNFTQLVQHKNINFKKIFYEILLELTKQLDFFLKEYNNARRIINRVKPKCVIFGSMSPFNSATLAFRKNCIDYEIPFVTWAHGGYGLTYSLAPYDVTDFRFCNNHISYGPYLKNLISNNKCILKELKFRKNYKIFPVGSNRLDNNSAGKKLKEIFKEKNNKKTILFLAGSYIPKNSFNFGRNLEKRVTSLWELHYDILYLLKNYKDKYNIIFKDYPVENLKSLWKKVLKDIDAENILYVSNEYSVNELLKISDLNILPWTSTTIFEALYYDADIFVIDKDIIEFDKQLKNEIYYFEDPNKLKLTLENYLKEGKFYKCEKNLSRKFFLNYDKKQERNTLINEALQSISGKPLI